MFQTQNIIDAGRRLPVLSIDEERTLFAEYTEAPDTATKLVIRNKIVQHNIGLVYSIANKFHGVADIANEGFLGLIKAVEKFQPERDLKFSTYAGWWIRASIMDYIIRNKKMVHLNIGTKQKKLFYNVSKMRQRIEAEGVQATPELIAERLQVTPSEVMEMQIYLFAETSLDTPVVPSGIGGADFSDDLSMHNILASEASTPDEAFLGAQEADRLAAGINEFRSTLRPVHLRVFNECLLGDVTYSDVAKEVSLTRERIRQISNIISGNFKSFCVKKGLTDLLSEGTQKLLLSKAG